MEPVFIDIHIHTSDDPDLLNESYDLETLKTQVERVAEGADYLVSLTDHNTINKHAYLEALNVLKHVLLGVELHIRNYDNAAPYHCHVLFNLPAIDAGVIDDINARLNDLYPEKVVSNDHPRIPRIDQIMNCLDAYEFLLLPHGGQNHSTFDRSIPEGVQFDKTMERSVYYNLVDGFTARNNKGLERTNRYFGKLGIKEFVNLVTSTDNYDPSNYPSCKAGRRASEFVPTWMFASPTFNGLRLSLSEASRLRYGRKPDSWAEYIQHVSLKNDHIDVDAHLRPGLNVVIGGSCSGKSLFIDSVFRRIVGDFTSSVYADTPYAVRHIEVTNPAGQHPHYLDQNYISKICDPKDTEHSIEDISILRSMFPSDKDERRAIQNGLSELGSQLTKLMQAVKEIERLQDSLRKTPRLSHLIVTDIIRSNPLKYILPEDRIIDAIEYGEAEHKDDVKRLDAIDELLSHNPLISHDRTLVQKLKDELTAAYESARFESLVRGIILSCKNDIDEGHKAENREVSSKRTAFEKLLDAIKGYVKYERMFGASLEAISKFRTQIKTREVESMGHKLYIDNEFELTKEKFVEVIDGLLKPAHKVREFRHISPESLFESRHSKKTPKVTGYDDFERRVREKFEAMNRKQYRVTTREGRDFDDLSPGWKTSVILDLILGWEGDYAPLIVDQPEDNLATEYINRGLLDAIKRCKTSKQIILVSHSATIPMLGDAQNIVMCKNTDNRIRIRSNPLEGSIDGDEVVDLIAEKTDGGKIAVKKRVKKYNLKRFRGPDETSVQER